MMIALIKHCDTTYHSYVLATDEPDFFADQKILVFTADFKSIIWLDVYKKEKVEGYNGYSIYRNAIIVDYDDNNYVKFRGLTCIGKDIYKISKRLPDNTPLPIDNAQELKVFAIQPQIPEWREIKTDMDIKTLERISEFFHDAIIVDAKKQGDTYMLKFDALDGAVWLQFVDVVEDNFTNKIYQILYSRFVIEKGVICWRIEEAYDGWIDGGYYFVKVTDRYITAKKLLWKIDVEL